MSVGGHFDGIDDEVGDLHGLHDPQQFIDVGSDLRVVHKLREEFKQLEVRGMSKVPGAWS